MIYLCDTCASGRALMRVATTQNATPQRLRATFTDSTASAYVGSVSDDGTMIGYLAPTDDGWPGNESTRGMVYDDQTGETVPLPFPEEERALSWPELSGDGLVATTWQICRSTTFCDESRIYAVNLPERTGRPTN